MVIAVRPDGGTPAAPPRKLEGEEELLLTGSEAIAHALRLAENPTRDAPAPGRMVRTRVGNLARPSSAVYVRSDDLDD